MLTIAIIGAGTMAKTIAKRAHELNIRTLCFAWNKGAVATDFVSKFYDINIFEVDRITEICRLENVNGVLATTELTIKIAAYIANKLGLNANPQEIAENITSKNWVRTKGANFKILKQPDSWHISKATDILPITRFPVIVKPVSYGGKRGISVVYEKENLQPAINYAFETIQNRNDDGIIIEQFLAGGQEYSVETLSFRSKHYIVQVTEKDSSGPPHCVELGHHQPASLSSKIRQKVELAIKDMLDCVGIQNGPCHTEIKIIDGELYLIEINARPGGDFIAYPLTELSSGYKYLTGIILTACDIFFDPEIYRATPRCAGVYFVTKLNRQFKDLFDNCENKEWLYRKNKVSEELQDITHNDSYHINSLIYCSDKKITLEDK